MPKHVTKDDTDAAGTLFQQMVPNHQKELGAFLRYRRESLDPTRLSIPYTGRRRTPGLRREEVAMLADVSTTWYTWLEQGREVKTSPATLSAITQALQCTEAETLHVFTLAGLALPKRPQNPCFKLSHANQAILDQLSPYPALIQNEQFDILGFNKAYEALIGIDLHALPESHRNNLYLAFSSEQWQSRLNDKEYALSCMVGSFRASFAKHSDSSSWQNRFSMMQTRFPEFTRLWDRYIIKEVADHHKKFHIPGVGKMTFTQVNWWSAPKNGERMLVYVPDDEETGNKLEQLLTNT